MPDLTHDSTSAWLFEELGVMLNDKFLTLPEYRSLGYAASTSMLSILTVSSIPLIENLLAFGGFAPPYQHSHKSPDFYILPDANTLPSVVAESAWSEPMMKFLSYDKLVWLIGGQQEVTRLILCRFKHEGGGKVSGWVELWGRDTNGNPTMLRHEVRSHSSRNGSEL
jgi:hypothetical protein